MSIFAQEGRTLHVVCSGEHFKSVNLGPVVEPRYTIGSPVSVGNALAWCSPFSMFPW